MKIVTRHSALVTYLIDQGIAPEDADVQSHATQKG